jgi:hypothetical protein
MKRATLWGLALLWTACEAPPVVPTADPPQNTEVSHIDGNIVAQTHTRGNAVVFLFDATRPPPPAGAGKPLAFALIPKDTLFGDATNDETSIGPFTAPFTLSLVPPGSYLLAGFIDLDGCLPDPQINCQSSSFIPWFNVTDEPVSGDVGGEAADPVSQQPIVVTIDKNTLQPATGVTVAYTDLAEYPVDRPAFSVCIPLPTGGCLPVDGGTTFTPQQPSALNMAGGEVFELDLTPVDVSAADFDGGVARTLVPFTAGGNSAFLAKWVAVDGGVALDVDGDGAALGPDFWPKVIVRKLADSNPLNDENVDRRGLPLANAKTYNHVDPTLNSQPAQVALTAFIPVTDVAALLTDTSGQAITTAVPVSTLHVVVGPTAPGFPPALDITDPNNPAPLTSVPPGIYGIYIIQYTGQTWRVPNELGPPFSQALDFTETDSQAFTLIVPP